VGAFEGATPLNTETYKDTWAALDRVLAGKPKDTRVLTYCTGGIRCVKVGAYLTQQLGFRNVGRLQGGIVNYTSVGRAEAAETGVDFAAVSKFKGLNFVFNDRMAEVG
jgi:predicted sulfurtransferase